MIPEIRRAYNADFTPERYAGLLRDLEAGGGGSADFRISETPIFLPEAVTRELVTASTEILEAVGTGGLSQGGRPGRAAAPLRARRRGALGLPADRLRPGARRERRGGAAAHRAAGLPVALRLPVAAGEGLPGQLPRRSRGLGALLRRPDPGDLSGCPCATSSSPTATRRTSSCWRSSRRSRRRGSTSTSPRSCWESRRSAPRK